MPNCCAYSAFSRYQASTFIMHSLNRVSAPAPYREK